MTVQTVNADGDAASTGDATLTVVWPPVPGWGHLLTQIATISHVSDDTVVTDVYGNATQEIASIDVVYAALFPVSETEQLLEAETRMTTFRMMLGPGVPLNAGDLVVIGGSTYRVSEALHFVSPRTGVEHHIEAHVELTTG